MLTIVIPFRNIYGRAIPLAETKWCARLGNVRCLLVDDWSEDGSFVWLSALYDDAANVSVIRSCYPQGKKYALRCAMEMTDTDYVITIDADVYPPDFLFLPFETDNLAADLYILPLVMGQQADYGALSLFGRCCVRFQQTEYVAIQSLTMIMAEEGHPVMCSGANLIVKRQSWLDSFAALHPDIPSGDDMFLLESFKHRGLCIRALYGKRYAATVMPEVAIGKLLRQRMRWAGKAGTYKDKDIRLCGIVVLLANMLALLPPFFLLKYVIDVWIIRRGQFYGLKLSNVWKNAFLLSLVYPWYVCISIVGGLLRKQKW